MKWVTQQFSRIVVHSLVTTISQFDWFVSEYNVYQPSPLNEKVLREKRKKLKETFDRVMRLYVSLSSDTSYTTCTLSMIFLHFVPLSQHNDDPELWAELKRKEVEYEKRRNKKVQYFESVKHAQTVQVDEIPLPQV